ncbi:MAG: ferric reductase-like transmembrane domain-containing protein [Promethearchaeota archaeon]
MPLKKEAIYIISATLSLYILILVLFLLTPFTDGFNFIIRFGAIFGFTSMFIATMMTPFVVRLYKIFGKPFVKIHHLFSITGLILITLHPVAFAIWKLDITVFLPDFTSWYGFWSLGGRLALILIYIAVLGALLRKKIKKNWRIIHILNYVALFLAYIHGVLIGSDFQNIGIHIIFTIMIILSFTTLFFKRYISFKRKRKS